MAKKKKSFFRRLLKWTGILFLLLIILAIVLPYIFKDEIVQYIKDEASKSIKAEVELGEVSLSFISTFPDFVLEMEGTSITGVDEFDGVTLLSTKKLEIALDLNSVLFGDSYVVKRVLLSEPTINVLVTERGIANYDIYIADSTADDASDVEDQESAPFKLGLQEYSISNGQVVYSDSTMAFHLALAGLNHTGKGDFTLEELVLSTKTTSTSVTMGYDGVDYLSAVEADIDCDIRMNLSTWKFDFQENNAKLNALELGFDGWFQMLPDAYDMDISFSSKDNKFRSLLSMVPGVYSPDFGDMKTDGTLGFSGRVFDKYSDVSMPGFNVDLTVDNAYFQYPDLPGKVSNIDVNTKINRAAGPDLDNLVIDVSKAHAEYGDNYVDVGLLLTKPMSDPNFKANLNSFVDLAKLGEIMPLADGESYSGIIETDLSFKGTMSAVMEERYDEMKAGGKTLIKDMNYRSGDLPYAVNVQSTSLSFDPHNITLESFKSKIGESDISATGVIDNYMMYVFNDEDLHGSFTVNSNYLNLDELMGIGEEEVGAEPTPEQDVASGSTGEESYEVIALPEDVNFNLVTNVQKVLYDGLEINEVVGGVNLTHSIATLENVRMKMLGGTLGMTGSYSTINPEKPKVSLGLNVDHFQISEAARYFNTVEKLAPIASKCKGFFSTAMEFNSELGKDWMPVYSTIFGEGNLFTKEVAVEGFKPLEKLAEKVKVDWLSKQTLQNVKCFFKIVDGKISVEPFDLKMGNIATSIGGSTSFEQDLDYVMTMKIPREEMGAQANAFVDGLVAQAAGKGIDVNLGEIIPVNVKIKGKVSDPEITTDLMEQGKNIMDDVKDQIIQTATDHINEKLEDVDAEIQKKVDEIMSKATEQADRIRAEGKKHADKVRKEGKVAADKVRKEGNAQADQLIEEAGSNPLKKKAAEVAADKLREETEEKARAVENEANNKANGIESDANAHADRIMAEAEGQAEKIRLEHRVGGE